MDPVVETVVSTFVGVGLGALLATKLELPRFALAVILITMLVILGGCSATPYAELGMGWNTQLFGGDPWIDGGAGPTGAAIEVGGEWDVPNNENLSTKCRWIHFSQWTVGPPWNDDLESSLDHFGCAVRMEFK